MTFGTTLVLFQDVRTHKTSIKILHYNNFNINFNTANIKHYTAVVVAHWYRIFYHLNLTKICAISFSIE